MKALPLVAVLFVLVMALSGCTAADLQAMALQPPEPMEEPQASHTSETFFVTFIDIELPEQDVFVESEADPAQLMRVTVGQADDPAIRGKMLYAAAEAIEHDPMELGAAPYGPFPKGDPLGFTLEEWWAATGQGAYTLHGDQATLSVDFENLVPNGVYTAWCGHIGLEPTFVMLDVPCGPMDGSENVFQADAEGNAHFELTMHALRASTDDYFADLAFAWHRDGQTYGLHPGDFGEKTHVHLLVRDPVPAPMAREPIQADIEFVTHIDFGMPEQDIFIESGDGASQVIRPLEEAEDVAILEQMIYAAAEATEHNPLELGPNPRGPFAKGEPIGVTLGEWLAATGKGTYTLEGHHATVDVQLENLVPNGVYTAWCGIITVNEVFTAGDLPCGAIDGSQSSFQADEDGNASYQVTMPALPASNETTFSDIAFAYHSDGQTCGHLPCEFGKNSHVQLFILEPPPAPQDLPME
ncbi:MAG: hypothetical protein HC802_08870 [Caldilineaceae bacterium]|nr:hypothetical protein [Caldilineaceae bacterium]